MKILCVAGVTPRSPVCRIAAVPGYTAAELLKLADLSMCRAKAGGGDRASS